MSGLIGKHNCSFYLYFESLKRALRPTVMASVPEILERIRKAVHAQVKEGGALKKAVFNYAYDYKRRQVKYRKEFRSLYESCVCVGVPITTLMKCL